MVPGTRRLTRYYTEPPRCREATHEYENTKILVYAVWVGYIEGWMAMTDYNLIVFVCLCSYIYIYRERESFYFDQWSQRGPWNINLEYQFDQWSQGQGERFPPYPLCDSQECVSILLGFGVALKLSFGSPCEDLFAGGDAGSSDLQPNAAIIKVPAVSAWFS